MITTTPLPTWKELAAPFARPALDDEPSAAPWRGKDGGEGQAFWFSRSAWAMKAIVRWWSSLHEGRKPVLWLPDYFCNQSTYPLREINVTPVFYPIDMDLRPDREARRAMAALAAPDLFVIVHYFGIPADAAAARSFCDETGAYLIEDAAHALGPAPGIGEQGDFIFYSPHKILAVPDGALLLMRPKDGAGIIREAANGGGYSKALTGAWIIRRTLQKILPEPLLARRARRQKPAFADDPPYKPLPPETRISSTARAMLADAAEIMPAAAKARRRNWLALRQALNGLKGCRPLEIADQATPYRFVLRCDDEATAAALFDSLHAGGCPAESWPDLPPEAWAEPGRHQAAIRLRRTLVLLPVHQTAGMNELIACCEKIL